MTITISKFKLAVGVIAVALLGVSTAAMATHTFSDVPDGEFYTEPVEWLADNGLTTGSPSGSDTFKPFDNVTRGEYATFNFRYDENIVQPALEELGNDIEDNANAIANLPDVYFAEIDTDGSVLRSSFGVTTEGGGDGTMDVNWPLDVDDCVWQATIAQKSGSLFALDANDGEVSLQTDFDAGLVADDAGIFVETRNSAGTITAMPVHILVTCGLPTGIFIPPILPPIFELSE